MERNTQSETVIKIDRILRDSIENTEENRKRNENKCIVK